MKAEIIAVIAAFILGLGALVGFETPRHAARTIGEAERVVSLSPSITELAFALGGGDRLVGVSAGVSWPPEALEVEQVGGFLDLDFERLVGLRPDVLFIQGRHAYVIEQAAELGIPVEKLDIEDIGGILRSARRMGEALGRPEAAEALVRRIEGELAEVRGRTSSREPAKVFLHLAYDASPPSPPFLTTGGGTFLTEVLATAGGVNVFADSASPYPDASVEALFQRSPDVVMVSVPGLTVTDQQKLDLVAYWRGLFSDATRVVVLTADCAQVPGPRVGELAREMERLLWPR